MLFNSIDFAVFLPIVFALYWSAKSSVRLQNALLIVSGSVFYGWWDWRYLWLLLFTSGVDYLVAMGLERKERPAVRKFLLGISLTANLGLLGFFKYYDFFVHSFVDAFRLFGAELDAHTLGWVLPVGISFYTFQSLSYTIDVYRRDLRAVHDPLVFFGFVGFFPQLLAGPIERARHMLPQFQAARTFDLSLAVDGSRQMLWGFFKKIVIADQCAPIVNEVFAGPAAHDASEILFAALLFAFQIYGDFSGYSDIAIGCARLFGLELMRNFAFPYFSRDIAEFWRRWHISLSTWFRDYLYIPLGGSRGNTWSRVRNTFIIFLVSGLWHGANYTFIVWGSIHALLFLPLLLRGANRAHAGPIAPDRWLPSFTDAGRMLITFLAVTMAWVFFRAADLHDAFDVIGRIATGFADAPGLLLTFLHKLTSWPVRFIGLMLLVEWVQREQQHGLQRLERALNRPMRWVVYYGLALLVLYHTGKEQAFIYFQF